jgi:hypothetical protein
MIVKRYVLLVSLIAVLALSTTVQLAGGAGSRGDTLELRSIMLELSSSMEGVVRGIALGDMTMVEEQAMRIAEHRRPPAEEMKNILRGEGGPGLTGPRIRVCVRAAGGAGGGGGDNQRR